MKSSYCVVLTLLSCAFVHGCGDDDDTALSGEPDSGARMDGAVGGGGAGTSGKGAGGSGGGGSGGSVATPGGSAAVKCGSTMCTAAGGAMGFMTACCFDEASSTCGTSAMGNPCALPPTADPRCPSVDIGGGIFMLASCCTAQGQCGIDATQFGAGCVELGEAATQAMMMGGGAFPITFPDPRACDDNDAGMAEDAGAADDAGL